VTTLIQHLDNYIEIERKTCKMSRTAMGRWEAYTELREWIEKHKEKMNMLICAECGHELQCIKTGMNVFVDRFTTYRGDLFQCPVCKYKMAKANDNNEYHNPPVNIEDNDIIHKQARDAMREQTNR